MKHGISIKLFAVFSIFVLILGVSLVFLNFYKSSQVNIKILLMSNIQTNTLNIKHYLDNGLKESTINEITAHLDSISSTNDLIENIYIFNEEAKLLYSSNRSIADYTNKECVGIFNISKEDILKYSCYTLKTKQYRGLTPYFYDTKIYLSQKYMDSLLYNHTVELFVEYALTLFFVFLIVWFGFSKIIKTPLERLRQFAYYEARPPENFFIKEIESIRHSLEMTFKRLHQEQIELYNLSTKDQLSGLYNKRSLIEKLEWLTAEKSDKKEQFAVVMLDLDNFKTINDSMGHNVGDKVLQEVADAIVRSVKKNDIVSRIGGDEFVIILSETSLDVKIIETLERIRHEIQTPQILQSIKYHINASMGIALFPKDGTNANTLIKNADIAMYKSKENGKNNYHFFTDSFNADIQKKIQMQNLLIQAHENNYFRLYYQPKVNIATHKVLSCEALIRLKHPTKGLISPYEFITIAEENGFIITLGYWVIQESVRQLQAWQNTPLKDLRISINLSAKQFADPNLVKKLKEYTQKIDRSKLDIELTESVFVDNYDKQYQLIHQIKALGFSLSLDDFGTGYSSLSYLKNIPFNTIKIDKVFIDDLVTQKGQAFVKMIINIARVLQLEVIAEGVEDASQERFLEEIACDCYQGYLCSKPLDATAFSELLRSKNYL